MSIPLWIRIDKKKPSAILRFCFEKNPSIFHFDNLHYLLILLKSKKKKNCRFWLNMNDDKF